eukprot:1038143-Amphidinium_carterae.1
MLRPFLDIFTTKENPLRRTAAQMRQKGSMPFLMSKDYFLRPISCCICCGLQDKMAPSPAPCQSELAPKEAKMWRTGQLRT